MTPNTETSNQLLQRKKKHHKHDLPRKADRSEDRKVQPNKMCSHMEAKQNQQEQALLQMMCKSNVENTF